MIAAAVIASMTLSASALAKDKPLTLATGVVPICVSVGEDDGKAVQDTAWIDAQIAAAEKLFGPVGVHFKKTLTRSLPKDRSKLETKKDRDALEAEMQKGCLNVMVVASLRDVDTPALMRMGVHWRPTQNAKKHYVIVSSSAMPTTMAHEIGHYFGLAHTAVLNNLMSYLRLGDAVFIDDAQKKKVVQFANISIAAKDFSLTPL